MKKPQPLSSESSFGPEELFFSVTDLKGRILFGNDVFIRVSKYPKEILVGAPHSIIRHPDMPRIVFKLLWDTIEAGHPIIAYVKNLAADGSFYWVMAFVFPVEDGYLSIRLKPTSPLWRAAESIYKDVLEVEQAGGMEASGPVLNAHLQKAGFSTYVKFMLAAAFTEIEAVKAMKHSLPDEATQEASVEISKIALEAGQELEICFERIKTFQKIQQSFTTIMHDLTSAFKNLKFIALNMTISAAKFGSDQASLGVVASEFSKLAAQIQEHLSGLNHFVEVVEQVIEKCALRVVSLEIQMLMVDFFIRESTKKIKSTDNAFSDMIANKVYFSRLFCEYTEGLEQEMQHLNSNLHSVSDEMLEVRKFTTGLEVIRQIGAVESARESAVKQTFSHYLEEMKKFIDLLQRSTSTIRSEMNEMQSSGGIIMNTAANLSKKVEDIFIRAESMKKN